MFCQNEHFDAAHFGHCPRKCSDRKKPFYWGRKSNDITNITYITDATDFCSFHKLPPRTIWAFGLGTLFGQKGQSQHGRMERCLGALQTNGANVTKSKQHTNFASNMHRKKRRVECLPVEWLERACT